MTKKCIILRDSVMFRLLLFTILMLSVSERVICVVSRPVHVSEGSPASDTSPATVSTLQFARDVPPLPKCCPQGQRLNERMEKCEEDNQRVIAPQLRLEWQGESDGSGPHVDCAPGDTLRLVADNATRRVHPLANGSLALDVAPGAQIMLQRKEFCADMVAILEDGRSMDTAWALLVCPCKYEVCLRKCCPPKQILVVQEIAEGNVFVDCEDAAPGEKMWQPVFDNASSPPHEVLVAAWPPGCRKGLMRVPPKAADLTSENRPVLLRDNGTAVLGFTPPMEVENFCLDFERNGDGLLSESAVTCATPLSVPFMDQVMAGVSMLGSVALLLVLVTSALLPELRVSAFGRALVCYTSSLLLSQVLGLWWSLAPAISSVRCVFTQLWHQFFLIASAFWLNAMCFDMGIAFSLFQCFWARNTLVDRRFIRYSIYAWGGPLALTFGTLVLQLSLPYGHPWQPFRWYFGCSYKTHTAQFLLFYAPMLIMLLSNLILLIYVAWCIRQLLKNRRILEIQTDSSNICPYTGKKRLLLFTRLLWAMGVLETGVEIITWASSTHLVLWHVTNFVDLSRALCLFAQVCCKRRVLSRLRQRITNTTSSSDDQRQRSRTEPKKSGGTICSSNFSSTHNTSRFTDLSTRSTDNLATNSKVPAQTVDIELQDMKTGKKMAGGQKTTARRRSIDSGHETPVDCDEMASENEIIHDFVPSTDKVSLYDIPKRENTSGFQNGPIFQQNVNYPDPKNMNTGDDPMEQGDLSNSPLEKCFPSDEEGMLKEKKNDEYSDGKPARLFRRNNSKVMVNPTFETTPEPNKQVNSSHKHQEGGKQVPELNEVDDNVLVNDSAGDVNDNLVCGPRNRGTVSVTSL